MFLSKKSSPPPKLFQFPMTHKGNLQDSQEIGNPLPPLLLEAARKTVLWGQFESQRTWAGIAEGRVWRGFSRNLWTKCCEMVSFFPFVSEFLVICLCNAQLISISFWSDPCTLVSCHSWADKKVGHENEILGYQAFHLLLGRSLCANASHTTKMAK